MDRLDPLTLLLTSTLLGSALLLVMLATRVGLGAVARGMRTWLAGDLAVLLGQGFALLEVLPAARPYQVAAWPLVSSLVMLGITLHWAALHRHRDVQAHHAPGRLLAAAGLSLATGAGAAGLPVPLDRVPFSALMVAMHLASMAVLLPLRRHLGVRLMLGTMGMAAALHTAMAAGALAGGPEPELHAAISRSLFVGLLLMLCNTLGFVLWLQEELRERLVSTAVTDALTGTLNRHGLLPQLQRELARAGRRGAPVSVALCDLDHFKRINDTLGHAAGDAALRGFVRRARATLRASDLVGRWGGEEFLFVLPDTACAEAVRVVERLRQALSVAPVDGVPPFTFSAGVASAGDHDAGYDMDELMARADARLYVAKETRDRIVGCTPQGAGAGAAGAAAATPAAVTSVPSRPA